MAEAYKCDRCGHLWEGDSKTLEGDATDYIVQGWFPDKIDLCINCANKLILVLRRWWKDEENEKVS